MSEERAYYDGKYTVKKRADGGLEFLRHGEPWPAADDLRFNNLVGVMFREQLEADATIAALTEKLRAVEAERDSYKTRAQVAESSINRAMGAAHDSMPEYPWNTMRKGEELATACWAWASTLKGTRQACDDMHATNSALRAELERKDAALKAAESLAHWSNELIMHLEREFGPQPRFSSGHIGKICAAVREFRAALQPKEPPCQTA